MMEITIPAHECESASPALDAALKRIHEQKNDATFRDMICTFVTEACRGDVQLYCPTDSSDNNNPLIFQSGNSQLYAFYTDRKAAQACAEISMEMGRSLLCANTGRIPLRTIIEAAQQGAILAFNLGLPDEVILPMQIHHTIHHLMNVHAGLAREPEGSSWGEWISILEKFVADGRDRRALPRTAQVPEVTLRIPVTPPGFGEPKIYRLG